MRATAPALAGALAAMGAPVERVEDAPEALRARRLELWRRMVEPVTVAWEGRPGPPGLLVRLPAALAGTPLRVWSASDGEPEREVTAGWLGTAGPRPIVEAEEVEGVAFAGVALFPRHPIPAGYHRLTVGCGSARATTLVVSARRRRRDPGLRAWGVFLPLYALRRSRGDWGVGDLTGLQDLLAWVGGLGGSVVATLPLLAAFLDGEPFEPSPYAPASRLFWNELFLDVERVAREGGTPRPRPPAGPSEPLVDYRRAMAMKRRALEAACRALFAEPAGSPGRGRLQEWIRANPRAEDYAAFRAATERRGASWWMWPQRERDGTLPKEGGHREAFRYHLFVQWQAARQMAAAGRRANEAGCRLYFDYPLGVNSDGYDVWRERGAFALDASAGAPPDPFFTGGQDWGFPPLHPERIREDGYRYPIACLRHLLRHAGVLRIDHVMGLHRLFWVPRGVEADRGVYVRYRAEELYAILSLEAARSGTAIVGEDLGTVPDPVRLAMDRNGLYRSFVAQMEVRPDPRRALPDPPAGSLAGLNTHDMPTFAGFWREADLRIRLDRGWMDRDEARAERRSRARARASLLGFLRRRGWIPDGAGRADPAGRRAERAALEGTLAHLAAGPAAMVVANLEDLWQETRPQNVPGTVDEYPNWRRRARPALEDFRVDRRVLGTLVRMDSLRRGPKA